MWHNASAPDVKPALPMSDPKSIHIQVGNNLTGVLNLGSIEGDVNNQNTPSESSTSTTTPPPASKSASECSPKLSLRPGPWRVFLSHTSEMRNYPENNSYIDKAERAVSATGHAITDMADFPSIDQVPASACVQKVRESDVYVGIYGMRYGSPVRDQPDISYTELEFNTATEAGLPRLIFMINTDSADLGLPAKALIDREFGERQDAFMAKVLKSGLTIQRFSNPDDLKGLLERSLRALAESNLPFS
jgi:hypothetical protein